MEQFVLNLFADYREFAFLISIMISIVVSVAGVLPSVFVTAANLAFFGFEKGLVISLIGEALGAIISFYLYRKGVDKLPFRTRIKAIERLRRAKGLEAFLLIIALRLFPFAPSGLVTLAGARSSMSLVSYSIASTIGKIPALFIEAYAVMHVLKMESSVQFALAVIAIIIILLIYRKKK